MKLLIVTQYFWPESFIINDLAATLARQGHSVTVATGKPNYPAGSIFDGYEEAGAQTEVFGDGITVVRAPMRTRRTGRFLNLLMNYASFAWSGLWWFPRLLHGREFDAIVAFMPSPITGAIPAILLKWTKKAHLAVWIQDLWPESLEATGYIRNRVALSAVGLMVRAIYGGADTLLVQSRAFIAPVAKRARRDKIVYYPNSVTAPAATEAASPLPAEVAELLQRNFCVVFAGNVGTAQAVETMVEAADLLRDLGDVRIVIVGSGSMSEWAARTVAERGLANVVLLGRFPATSMPEFYRQAAALLVTLKGHEILSYTVPSKVQSYLAAGRPIIAALNGEGARIVGEARAGLSCNAEDPDALAACVRALYQMPDAERARMGSAGRDYFLEHFDMERQAECLTELLKQRIAVVRRAG
jgi:glycosyltransferase involved in cell wall biosynthesis